MKKKNQEFKYMSYMKNYKTPVIIGPLMKALEALSDVIVPFLLAQIINIGITNNDLNYILKYGIIIIVLNIAGMFISVIGTKCAAVVSQGVAKDIRNDIFTHVNTYSHAELDKFSTTTILNRAINDVSQIRVGISLLLRQVMRLPFLIFGSIIMTMLINMQLSLIFLFVTPLLLIAVFTIMKKMEPLLLESKVRLDRTTNIMRENLSGVRVVRAFNKQDYEINKFIQSNLSLNDNDLKYWYISSILMPLIQLIVYSAVVILIYWGGIQINIGSIKQGDLISFISYFTQISSALVLFARIITMITRMRAAEKRINDLFIVKNSITDPKKPVEINYNSKNIGNVEFRDVCFSYNNVKNVVNHLNLKVKTGETIGIIGCTGSGKSSITNLIPRFYDATSGEVLVAGNNVKKYKVEELRNLIGICQQNPLLFEGTIRSNLIWRNINATDDDIIYALKIAQAYDFVKEYPDFLDHKVLRGGTNFSGGQKQRLTIARALVGKPPIVILDDSASALDFATDAKLRKSIKTMMNNTTTFIVSQRTNSIKDADKIIVIDAGDIVAIDTHENLLKNCVIYKEIYDSQNKRGG